MVGERRSPGVEHRGQPDTGTEMFGIGGDGDQRLCGGLEQDIVDHGLVVEGDVCDRGRQGEHDMEVGDR